MAHADVTLTLRGERVPLRNAVSSVYNRDRHELLVITPTALYLYGKMLTAGGDLRATLAAAENAHYQFALHLPWLDAYSVIVTTASGKVEHRIVSSDLETSLTSHTLMDTDGGQFYMALVNPHRRELITADSDGGIKVWALRVVATAQNNGGFKGVLRVHTAANSTKKPHYRHLRMSCDGHKLFAATSGKVFAFDAASCHRLSCCLREDRRIYSMECGNSENSVYLVFRSNMRKVWKYAFVVKKGVPQFRKVGEYEHDHEIAVFIENNHQSVDANGTSNGVVMIDNCARFTSADLNIPRAEPQRNEPAVVLPFHPPSERYHALHAAKAPDGRDVAFTVWSTGFCILELFFMDSQGRLPCDSFNGEWLKRYDDVEDPGGSISIYQQKPTEQVIMFKTGIPTFRFASLPTITTFNSPEEATVLPIVDYVLAADALVALWPHGLMEKHNLSDNRVFTIADPFEFAQTTATTMTTFLFDDRDYIVVGDSTGVIHTFPILSNDTESHSVITRKQAHSNDSIAKLISITNNALLSVSQSGEVKHWQIKKPSTSPAIDTKQTFEWELLGCFRTYSAQISSATFEFPEFLFCGFDSGSVECWRLPKGPHLDPRAPPRIAVVKRALHTIDLHLAPVLDIVSESGAGTAVLASPQPVADNFSWVFSYDKDAIILIWCFALDLFFPHRRIKVHEVIKGIYISPLNGYLDLFVYVDHWIDRVDHLGSDDKEAVKQRLQRGRELSALRDLKNQDNGAKQAEGPRKSSSTGLRTNALTPDSYDQRRFMAETPSVRINIILPAVEHKVNAVRKPAGASPDKKTIIEEPKSLSEAQDASTEATTLQSMLSSSPTRILNRPSSKTRVRSPLSRRSSSRTSSRLKTPSETTGNERHAARAAKSKYFPGENSVPSSFQQAKPRVYRKAVNPLDSVSSQARCAVITTGDVYVSSSSSSSSDESDPTDVSRPLFRSSNMIIRDVGAQEKVSVVSLVEDEDESILLLDYRPRSRQVRTRRATRQSDDDVEESSTSSYEIPFLPWDRMTEHDRRVELMAASKSKCIQQDAERDDVVVPPVKDFDSVEISVQLGVRTFTRWFVATRRHHQRIRERFLTEELTFAASDPIIHQKLAAVGLSPPSEPPIEQSTWQEFVAWYCLGLTTRHQTIPLEVLQRERLKARTEYLEQRLHLVAQSEVQVQEEEERAGPCAQESEERQQVFIFEHFVKRSLSDLDHPTSWENTSLANRHKELTFALLDPIVQVAAMRNDLELPQVSISCIEDVDIVALAGKFVSWWKTTRNIYRRDFLKREVHEASTNQAILELLSNEQHENGGTNAVFEDFFESYFKSDTARHVFLTKKLFDLKRKSRITSVARYGKLPAPCVMETLPLPLTISFEFVEREFVEDVETEEFIEVIDDEMTSEEHEMVLELEQSKSDAIENQREREEEELRRLEGENVKITLELIDMAREDALSHEYNSSFVESDDEVEVPSLRVPKRTDFSRSYFFGNLPMHFRKVASSGWGAGSGIDNGDEEHEEEEQMERERERQRLLDEQEAERLLELERQAERARIEKEREEKAFQFRRVRQAELKKVLVHQAELEAKRQTDLELAHEGAEQRLMQQEDEHAYWQRDQLLRDQNGMRLEDLLGSQTRKELREAAVTRMRLLLHEQTCMFAEDRRSLLLGQELHKLERERAVRTAFLSELYTPFRPFYQSSAIASEIFLPRLEWRLEQEQLRRTAGKPVGDYTIPVENTLVFNELDQELYLARDSRKFKLLMGLPLRTPSSQKRPRIPTADAIIAMQQQQRKLAEFGEERQEPSIGTGKDVSFSNKVKPHTQVDSSSERSRLPNITLKPRSVSSLTDLKEAYRKQHEASKRKSTKTNQQSQQIQSLPFFRGNLLVQGHGQARSTAYLPTISYP